MGIDLVRIQLLIAQGHPLSSLSLYQLSGDPLIPPPLQSIQLRITAEDASNDWILSIGKISSFRFPTGNGVRVDTHLLPSVPAVVGTDFDSLLAKIIVTAPSWDDVVRKARRALDDTSISGVKTNLEALRGIVASEAFSRQECDTQWLEANIPSILGSGKQISASLKNSPVGVDTSSASATGVSAASNVLFRKGDAWSISLSKESSTDANLKPADPIPSHLQVTRVLRNEFPASLTARSSTQHLLQSQLLT